MRANISQYHNNERNGKISEQYLISFQIAIEERHQFIYLLLDFGVEKGLRNLYHLLFSSSWFRMVVMRAQAKWPYKVLATHLPFLFLRGSEI